MYHAFLMPYVKLMSIVNKQALRVKNNAIKDSYDTVHNALVHCKLQGKMQ
jgi:hypothetical protein